LERTFSLDEYLSVVKKIRVELEPFTKKVKNLLDEAKVYARDIVDKNKDTDMYSYFDYECDQEQYRTLAKQKFSELLNSETTIDKICTDV
jgi:hypothetical protein